MLGKNEKSTNIQGCFIIPANKLKPSPRKGGWRVAPHPPKGGFFILKTFQENLIQKIDMDDKDCIIGESLVQRFSERFLDYGCRRRNNVLCW